MAAISAGEVLRCSACGHTRKVSQSWIESVCRKYFSDRTHMGIYNSDLGRFKCARCGKKDLRILEGAPTPVGLGESREIKGRQLAVALVSQASSSERQILLSWAQQLLALRESSSPVLERTKKAIAITVESRAIFPFLRTLGRELKRIGWDERSLSARIGLSAAAFAALLLSGKGAGIAALGGAIGVPLWVVFGAGGAFAGVLIEEITRVKQPDADPEVIEGEVILRTTDGDTDA